MSRILRRVPDVALATAMLWALFAGSDWMFAWALFGIWLVTKFTPVWMAHVGEPGGQAALPKTGTPATGGIDGIEPAGATANDANVDPDPPKDGDAAP